MREKKTAGYRIIPDSDGNCYCFFCDVSGAVACITKPVKAETPERELELAWQSEGVFQFNKCHRCGKWVIDVMYNAEVLECVKCAPYEEEPLYCKSCGTKLTESSKNCPVCGKPLLYEGGANGDA